MLYCFFNGLSPSPCLVRQILRPRVLVSCSPPPCPLRLCCHPARTKLASAQIHFSWDIGLQSPYCVCKSDGLQQVTQKCKRVLTDSYDWKRKQKHTDKTSQWILMETRCMLDYTFYWLSNTHIQKCRIQNVTQYMARANRNKNNPKRFHQSGIQEVQAIPKKKHR